MTHLIAAEDGTVRYLFFASPHFNTPTAAPMIRLSATLPTLGTVPIDFHRESAHVLEFIGERELDRLRQVPHLGVAAQVFTGVNHSRLEYVFLQCAIIGLLGKLYRNNEAFAISNRVALSGLPSEVSSGEELLKCWTLLSNYGHTQYTYGVERSFLQAARRDRALASWLCSATRHRDLRSWCRAVIDDYRDEHAHFLIAIARIYQAPAHSRRKGACIHYLRNLLLSSRELFPSDHTKQYKLSRLRELFAKVRLLSMVALDAYYSHHPIRLQLDSALLSLADLSSAPGQESGFEHILGETAGWLADELYLHPRCVAVQREYEIRLETELPGRFAKVRDNRGKCTEFLKNVMWNGFGRPSSNTLHPLVRLTFPTPRQPMLGRHDLFDTLRQVESELAVPPYTYASVDRNRFSRAVHLDLLFHSTATPGHIGRVYTKVYKWLIRSAEADALARVRSLVPADQRADERTVRALQHRFVQLRLDQERSLLSSVFNSVVAYLLPASWRGLPSEMLGDDPLAHPVWLRVVGTDGRVYDQISPELTRHLEDNPRAYHSDRLQELHAQKAVIDRTSAPFILACIEKYIVRDQFGKMRDEWDGVVLQVADDGVRLTIIESKNLGSRRRSEDEAFTQLKESIKLLCERRELRYRRRRLRGIGATLECMLPAT